MILIILTEKNEVSAFKAVFARYTYIAIPLSVLFVKYFPDIGRYYNPWTWTPEYCGITTNKNELGYVIAICGVFFVWDLIEMRTAGSGLTSKAEWFRNAVLLLMIAWLIAETNSSTALVTIILGVGIILYMRRPIAKRQINNLGTYTLVTVFLVLFLYSVPGLLDALVKMVGRDMTLTGRTDLWADLLREPINPLIGTGYKSFWLGPGAQRMWMKYYFHPNQAHNGYLEMYLNSGLIGVSLLIAMIISTGSKLKKELLSGNSFGIIRFSFLVVAVLYNWTEAMFTGPNLLWIILLIAALNYPRPPITINRATAI
ncbi:MAG: O-antigen ligase family protein [Nitrospirae bacterium]|nr:O-antigen ligase family protein [Nitrospirota bacterium]